MSARRTPHGLVWRTLWRNARSAWNDPKHRVRSLAKFYAQGGMAVQAVECLYARASGDALVNCREARRSQLTLWRAWRAHVLAGGSLSWQRFDRMPPGPGRVEAMQALATARREGAPLDSSLPEAAAAVLLRWKAGAR